MDFKKFGNFNWIEMDSKDQNLDTCDVHAQSSVATVKLYMSTW